MYTCMKNPSDSASQPDLCSFADFYWKITILCCSFCFVTRRISILFIKFSIFFCEKTSDFVKHTLRQRLGQKIKQSKVLAQNTGRLSRKPAAPLRSLRAQPPTCVSKGRHPESRSSWKPQGRLGTSARDCGCTWRLQLSKHASLPALDLGWVCFIS